LEPDRRRYPLPRRSVSGWSDPRSAWCAPTSALSSRPWNRSQDPSRASPSTVGHSRFRRRCTSGSSVQPSVRSGAVGSALVSFPDAGSLSSRRPRIRASRRMRRD